MNQESSTTKNKFPYADKWLSNNQINHILCNHLQKTMGVTDAQVT